IIESFRSDNPHDTAVLEEDARKNEQMVSVASAAAGYGVALAIMCKVIEWPHGPFDAVMKVCYATLGAVCAGTLLSWVFHPICRFFVMTGVRIMEEIKTPELIQHAALTEFVRHWHEFKLHTPEHLRPCFDELYTSYIKNGAKLIMKPEQASKLINDIITACL